MPPPRLPDASGVVEMVQPRMGAEDFSYMLGVKPGAYLMLGAKRPGHLNPGLHHPCFDFNDAILSTGASYWATLVEQQLADLRLGSEISWGLRRWLTSTR